MGKNQNCPSVNSGRLRVWFKKPSGLLKLREPSVNHVHDLKKTRVVFVEFDDVSFDKLAADPKYFGEGNSKGRILAFDFEFCLNCNLRLLDGKPIVTHDILVELDCLATNAKNGEYLPSKEITVQHSDFETLNHLIEGALALGKIK